MALKVDLRFGQVSLRDLYLRLHNISGTKDVAYYAISLFDERAGSEVPALPLEQRYYTFGQPAGHGLPRFDVSQNAWQQCYDDLKARFRAGLLPWADAMREEDGAEVVRMPPPEPPPSAETSNPAQPDTAPSVADAPPAADVTEGAGAYPGLFLQRDDEARLRADVIAAISMRKREMIDAINYGSGLTEEMTAFTQYNNARAIGQEIPQSTVDLAEAYMRRTAREQQIRDHADRLETAAMNASLPMLQAMIDTHQEGWP